MAALGEVYFKKETLEQILKVLNKKDEKGISITISINDDSNQWGQNISAYVSQSKEDREAKKDRYYTGNGKVFWTDGKIQIGTKDEKPNTNSAPSTSSTSDEVDDLPF